jgi:hypothetical protein
LEFVATCGQDGTAPVPVEERVAVFDDDGTLWCEKPVAIQLDFILRRFVEMAEADPALRDRQPWKGGYERDHAWFNAVLTEHNAGDDHNVRTLAAGVLAADAGIRVRTSRHEPTRSCAACSARARYLECASGACACPGPGERVRLAGSASGHPCAYVIACW